MHIKIKLLLKRPFLILLLHILLYLYIYNPYINVLGIQSIRLLYPLALILYIFKYNHFNRSFFLFKKEIFILVLWLLYTVWHTISGGDFTFTNIAFSLFFDGYCLSFCLYLLYTKCKLNVPIIDLLFSNAIIASCISLVLLLIPNMRQFVMEHFSSIDNTYAFLQFRCFGISAGLTFDYAILQGLALSYCLMVKKSYTNLLLIPLLLISILFNARIGIIAPLLIVLYLLFWKIKLKIWLYLGVFYILFLSLLQSNFFFDNIATFSWVEAGIEEIFNNLTGNGQGATMENLTSMHILPHNITEWLFGTGKNYFESPYGNNTDIGYFIQLMYGGISFLILNFSWLFCILFSLHSMLTRKQFHMLLFIVIIFLICNYKGSMFVSNCAVRAFMLLCLCWRMQRIEDVYNPIYKNKTTDSL